MSELPAGWRRASLGDVATVIAGQSPPGSSYNVDGNGMPFFQGKAEFGELRPEIRKWTTAGAKFAETDDILLSVRAPVGPTNLAPTRCAIGRGLMALRAGTDLDQRYLLWAVRAFAEDLAAQASGSTFSAVSGAQVRSLLVPVPPLDEQRRIVAILEDHLSRLDAATASLAAASRRADLMLSTALTGLARPDDPVMSLGNLADIGTGSTPSRSDSSNYDGGTIPWVTSGDISQERITKVPQAVTAKGQALGRLKVYPVGTLVVAMYGEGKTRGTVGRLGIAAAMNQACAAVQVRDPGQLDWIESVLRGNYAAMRRMAAGGVQPNLNLSLVRSIPIPLPLPAEREARLEQLKLTAEAVARIRESVIVSERRGVALRRSLLAAAFRGDLAA